MEYSAIALVCVVGLLAYREISVLKREIQSQGKRLDQLARLTGHGDLSSPLVPDEIKEQAIQLKRAGKEVEAIKKIREETQMDLVEAKRYVDKLV